MTGYCVGIGLYLLGGLGSLVVRERWKSAVVLAFAVPATVLFIAASVGTLAGSALPSASIGLSYPIGTATFAIDSLSAFFVLVIAIMSLVSLIYASGYLRSYVGAGKPLGSHHLFLVLLIVSMLLLVTIENAILFLFVWEIMSLSSFFSFSSRTRSGRFVRRPSTI